MFVNGCWPVCLLGILVSEEFRAENINKKQWQHKRFATKNVKNWIKWSVFYSQRCDKVVQDYFPGLKSAYAWRWPLTSNYSRGYEWVDPYLYSPHTPLGRGKAQLYFPFLVRGRLGANTTFTFKLSVRYIGWGKVYPQWRPKWMHRDLNFTACIPSIHKYTAAYYRCRYS